ncbi:pyridoxal phosphate-dependent aminotransferase, partial [Francisella tularensis subsp. holarctica]|nr:pyridoxal phosphate-dependent aminotransferase [Francisella tularensis subsp. holarctica]
PYSIQAEKLCKNVYYLNIGQPDIKTPKAFMDAIRDYDKETIAYSIASGEPCLIKAISKYYKRFDMVFAEDEILITTGGS